MKNKVIKLNDKSIKREACGEVHTLREEGSPLRFRFHAARNEQGQRVTGTWFVLRRGKWHWLGHWPALTSDAVKRILPEKIAALVLDEKAQLSIGDFECVGDVLNWYDQRTAKDANRSRTRKATIRSAIKCHLLPQLGSLSIKGLTRQALDDSLIWPLQEHHSLSTVKSVLAVLKQSFKRAEKLGRIEHDPLAGVVFSDFISSSIEPKDGRLLSSDVGSLLNGLTLSDRVTQSLIVMLLCHGTRITETLSAKWTHIDLTDRQWRLPMADTKTNQWHTLPLTEQVIEWLEGYRMWQSERGYQGVFLFPGHARAQSLSYSSARKLIIKVSEGAWSAHDCRKALKTKCTDLGIDHSVSERLLNHSQSKQDKAYDQSLFAVPMRDALNRYHAWLDSRGFTHLRQETGTRSTRSFNRTQVNELAA